jgi:type II secretion system (T2SS) protein E
MTRLGQLLVRADIVSENNLARALGIQNFAGGRLGTLLLERGSVDEDSLGKTLALQHGCEYISWRVLAEIPPVVIAALPAKFAIKHAAVPYERGENHLKLALRDPGDLRILDELFFVTGRKIIAGVAPEVRIYQALEKYYGERRTPRYAILAEKISRPVRTSRSPSNAPPPPPEFFPGPKRRATRPPAPQEIWGDPADADGAEPPIIQSWKLPDQVVGGWAGTASPGMSAGASIPSEPETISWEEMPAMPSLWLPEASPVPDRGEPSAPEISAPREERLPPEAPPITPQPQPAPAATTSSRAADLSSAVIPSVPTPDATAPEAPFSEPAVAPAAATPVPAPPPAVEEPAVEVATAEGAVQAEATPQPAEASQAAVAPGEESLAVRPSPIAPSQEIPREAGLAPPEIPAALAVPPAPAQPQPMVPVAGTPMEAPAPAPVFEKKGPPIPPPPPAAPPPPPGAFPAIPASTDFPEVTAAIDRDAIATAALTALARRFVRSAVFVAKPDAVTAWGGEGEGISAEDLRDISIPWTDPSVFLNVRLSRSFYLGPLPPLPRHQAIAIAMGAWPAECLVQPILIREKPVAFLYAEFGDDQGATPMDLAYMRELATAASAAFVSAIRLKKKEI